MLNYQLTKHTNQMISYYTKEIILYNYTCILGTSSINNLSTAYKKTCYNFCRLFTTCEFLCLLRGVNKLSVFHIKWFFSVNQYLTGLVFSSRSFQTCQLFSFVDIFLVFGQQEGRASFWGP